MSSIEVEPDRLMAAAGRVAKELDDELSKVRHALHLVAIVGTTAATGGEPAAGSFERLRVAIDQAAVRLKLLVELFGDSLRQAGDAYTTTDHLLGSPGGGP